MRSHADPYARKRAFWPILRLFARWVIWRRRALAASGLLHGRAARWLGAQLGLVEHGLRCLLVIGCQKLESRPRRFPRESGDPWAPASAGDAEKRTRRDLEQHAFSLSLAAFNLPPTPKPVIPDAQHLGIHLPASPQVQSVDGSSDGRSPVEDDAPSHSAHPGESRDEQVNARADEQAGLASRLAAVFDVLANPDHHIARMARHIARRGIKLKPRPTTRPSGAEHSLRVRIFTECRRNCASASSPPDTS